MVSVGSVITGAFRLFGEQWKALLIWAGVTLLFTIGGSMLLFAGGASGVIAPRSSVGAMRLLVPFYLFWALMGLVQTGAAFRAVMQPSRRAAGFLRLGMDELRLLGLAFVWFTMNMILYMLLVMVAAGVIGALVGVMGSPGPGIYFLLLIVLLPIYGVMIYVHVRLSPAIPLTLLRGHIVLGEAWRLTQGQFWRLFAAYAAIFLILVVGYVALIFVAMGPLLNNIGRGIAPSSGMTAQLQTFGPFMVLTWLASTAFTVCAYAMWAGSVGTATQQLLGANTTDYAATFE